MAGVPGASLPPARPAQSHATCGMAAVFRHPARVASLDMDCHDLSIAEHDVELHHGAYVIFKGAKDGRRVGVPVPLKPATLKVNGETVLRLDLEPVRERLAALKSKGIL